MRCLREFEGEMMPQIVDVATVRGYRYVLRGSRATWFPCRVPIDESWADGENLQPFRHDMFPKVFEHRIEAALPMFRDMLIEKQKSLRTSRALLCE